MSETLSARWSGRTPEQRTIAMRRIAEMKHAKMSPREKKAQVKKMVAGRGKWVDGVYIRAKKNV